MHSWRKYNGALIPDRPPHFEINDSREQILNFLKKSGMYFARWESNFDCNKKTNFWFIINDKPLEIMDYDLKTRNKIRKGLKECQVKKIKKDELIKKGYDVYISAFNNYQTYLKSKSVKKFVTEIDSTPDSWEYWGVFYERKLIAYSKVMIVENYAEYRSAKFHPKYLKYRPSEALIYSMNRNYLNDRKFKYVNNGTRSISHKTNFPNFLIKKFKFRKAYCKLNIVYSNKIKYVVKTLYPFINIFRFFNLGPIRQLNILLKQEEIVRSFKT